MVMAKKYSRVESHFRDGGIGAKAILVRAHIRKNPKYKEAKMQNGLIPTEERKDPREPGAKQVRPTYVHVKIMEADGHYLVAFNYAPYRIFHDMKDLLFAIKVEVKKLNP